MVRVPLVNFGQSLAEVITKAPSTRIRFCLKTSMFFSGLAYRAHTSDENDRLKRIFKNALQSGDFLKRRLFVYVWTNENGGFRIRCHVSFTSSITHAP